MVNLPVSIPRNILVATLEAGSSTLAGPIRRKYAYFTAARRASKQRIRLSGHFWCQKPMARWHHGQPRRRNQPPRAAGRSLSTQNCRRRAGSVPRDPPRTRFGAPPTRRWSRFLCYLVRLVAHAPGGLRSAERTRRDDSKRPTWHRFRRGAGGARAAFRFGEPNDLPRGPTTYPTTYNRRQRLKNGLLFSLRPTPNLNHTVRSTSS